MSREGDRRHADPREEGSEALDILRRYVIQETVDPLKAAGRTLIFGSAAAVFLGVGSLLVLLGFLRVMQTETGSVFAGSLSWLPYGITAFLGLAILGCFAFVLLRPSHGKARRKAT